MGLSNILLIPGLGVRNPAYQILVKTDNAGTSNSDQFTLPAEGTYDVDWGDGTVETKTGEATHTYASGGDYVIKVTGGLQRIVFSNGGDRLKLLEIQNWGAIAWTSMANAYWGCANMIGTFKDSPNLSGVSQSISMFRNCSLFNSPIGNWNISSVTRFDNMFNGATSFNQPIGSWNVSAVTNMASMFQGATAFNQNIGAWNVSSVTSFQSMFQGATAFNNGGLADINNWSIRTTGTVVMQSMFNGATSFNQNIGSWNTSAVTTMANMFSGAAAFNQNIGSWNTAAVTTMLQMFINATNFNNGGSDSIKDWNTAAVTTMQQMLRSTAFNQPIGSWNTAAVTTMLQMFLNNTSFNQNIGGWSLRLAGVDMTSFLDGATGLSTENYSRTLIGWANYVSANSNTPASVTLGVGNRTYNNTAYTVGETYNDAVAARAYLTGVAPDPAWTITDGGEV
jgi:surface protein